MHLEENGTIESIMLGIEGHGILTFMIRLKFSGTGQGFGGYALDGDKTKAKNGPGFCAEAIRKVLEAVGVNTWEELPGKNVRVRRESTDWSAQIIAIGHIVEDRWYNIREHAAEFNDL